jgi:DNA-binding response OmpR family regulator
VDDEEDFVRTLAERLLMRNIASDVALSGEQALQMLQDHTPDVMVLDLKMPDMDGLEVLRLVRNTCPLVQVIILTGHGSERDEEAARRLGACDYLQKPIGIDELLQALHRANDISRKGYLQNHTPKHAK